MKGNLGRSAGSGRWLTVAVTAFLAFGAVTAGVPRPGALGSAAAAPSGAGAPYRILANISVGATPQGLAFDSATGEVFVANGGSNNTSVISASTWQVTQSVAVGVDPFHAVYDSAEQEIAVTDFGDNAFVNSNISLIAIANGAWKSVAEVPVGSDPWGIAYDSATGELFVANDYVTGSCFSCWNLTVVSDSSPYAETSIALGEYPTGVVYDPARDEVFVSNGHNVSVICDGGTACGGAADRDKIVDNVTTGGGGWGLTYDPAHGLVLVAGADGNLEEISDSTDTIVGNATGVGDGTDVVYDPADGDAYVSHYGSTNVSIFSETPDRWIGAIPVGSYPSALALDPGRNELFVANQYSNNVTVVQLPSAPSSGGGAGLLGLPGALGFAVVGGIAAVLVVAAAVVLLRARTRRPASPSLPPPAPPPGATEPTGPGPGASGEP